MSRQRILISPNPLVSAPLTISPHRRHENGNQQHQPDASLNPTRLTSSGGQPKKRRVNERRAQQNREAQKAFRKRKNEYIKDLELKVEEMDSMERSLIEISRENAKLKKAFDRMKSQIASFTESENATINRENVKFIETLSDISSE